MTERLAPTCTNLQDEQAFPSFSQCPHEDESPYDYYRDREDGVFPPTRHWCYLGEITERVHITHLRLTVKDRKGDDVITAFYLDQASQLESPTSPVHPNVPMSLTNKGNTIAILYAQRHDFLDRTVGFRIEDADQVQVRRILWEGNLLKDRPT